jgi:uncharacterized protein YbaA (DUF1428 family)
VFRPDIAAGMEQANDFACLWIKAGNVRSLEPITVDASEGEITENGWSAVLQRDNVIDLKWCRMQRRRQSTVFATSFRSLPNFADYICVQ